MTRKPWQSILVAVADPSSRRQHAVTRAAALAKRTGASLELLHIYALAPSAYDAWGGQWSVDAQRTVAADRLKGLEKIGRRLTRRGISVTCRVVSEYPAPSAIIAHAKRISADLLIAESSRHSALARVFLTHTDWELIRQCPIPLWLVKSSKPLRGNPVLAAVDPSHSHTKPSRLDDKILLTAHRAAALIEGRVTLAHIFSSPLTAVPGAMMDPIIVPASPPEARQYRKRIERTVSALGRRHRIPKSRQLIKEGSAAELIAQSVRATGAQLLVMGSISRSGLDRLLIGNTAERVIDHVACDVLLVRPDLSRDTAAKVRRRSASRTPLTRAATTV